ncbi:hypothetical protein OBBRIDRAFT_161867 [Obba rivulosa]|uniref:Uncharacterized protein n=1 Tax=Obba rivulosa TaxID=1052685 RepID=A0A8E2J448_9APHY|nr:hypothetical protein OBBRIDRAFT_161867 [Obba rivulosa]
MYILTLKPAEYDMTGYEGLSADARMGWRISSCMSDCWLFPCSARHRPESSDELGRTLHSHSREQSLRDLVASRNDLNPISSLRGFWAMTKMRSDCSMFDSSRHALSQKTETWVPGVIAADARSSRGSGGEAVAQTAASPNENRPSVVNQLSASAATTFFALLFRLPPFRRYLNRPLMVHEP